MPTFVATPAEVHNSLRFEADCTVGNVEPHATPSIAAAVKVGDQVTHIGEDEVTDRAELRSQLAQLPDTTQIQFSFVHGNRTAGPPATSTDFESSVTLNGATCAFATARSGMSKEEAEEEADYRQRMEAFVKVGAKAGAPGLAEFTAAGDAQEARTLRTTLRNALSKVEPGRCVIGIGDAQFNPVDEVKILADELKRTAPVLIDFGVKLRHRASKEQIRTRFVDAMEKGQWFVVLRSTKSIVLLGYLGALFEELHENEEEKKKALHPEARLIICGEPHPHFPPALVKGSKCLQIKTAFEQSSLMYESVASSMSALRIASDQDAVQPNKKVKIASAVTVVDIDPREVSKQDRPPPRPQVNVAGTVKQKATFAALPHDKFFGISFAGNRNRIALASSLGNVYIVDDSGSSLMSFHAHDAAVWDVSFSSEHDFVTGGEDQNAVVWTRDAKERDALVCKDVVKCANDVYAVQHSTSGRAVAVGGLMPKITIRGTETGKVESVNLPTSNQAMASVGTDCIVSGGGDGSVFLIDTNACKAVSTCTQHTKKCPAVTATGNVVISGSFDCTVRLWDTRSASQQSLHTMKFQHYVTGLAADENYLTACVGDNLYLWDTRNLSVVLGGQPQAWTGLSRAVCIDAASRQIVSASPDGIARFWTFAAGE